MNKITKGVAALAATSSMSIAAVTSLAGSADAAKPKNPFRYTEHQLCSEARPDDGHNVVNLYVNNTLTRRIKVHITIEDFDTAPHSIYADFTDTVYGKNEIATDDKVEMALRVYFEYGTHIEITRPNGRVLYSKSFYDEGCAHD